MCNGITESGLNNKDLLFQIIKKMIDRDRRFQACNSATLWCQKGPNNFLFLLFYLQHVRAQAQTVFSWSQYGCHSSDITLSYNCDQSWERSFPLPVSYHEKSLSRVPSVELLLHLSPQVCVTCPHLNQSFKVNIEVQWLAMIGLDLWTFTSREVQSEYL